MADQQKAGKQGRDYSIQQFSTQLHPIITFNAERYVGWVCILNCFILPCFPDLLSLHLITFLMFFTLVYVTFF